MHSDSASNAFQTVMLLLASWGMVSLPAVGRGAPGAATGPLIHEGQVVGKSWFGGPFELEFEVPGNADTPAELQRHLYMPSRSVVVIDYAENIRAAGIEERDVIMAAVGLLDRQKTDLKGLGASGDWQNGLLVFQEGAYTIADTIRLPARLGILGAPGKGIGGQSGTRFVQKDGGNLESDPDAYMLHVMRSDSRNHNGNFSTHWSRFSVDARNRCNGILWGSAQTSSFGQIDVYRAKTALTLGTGTRNARIHDLDIAQSDVGIDSEGVLRADFDNINFGRIKESCFRFTGVTVASIDGMVAESVGIVVEALAGQSQIIVLSCLLEHGHPTPAKGVWQPDDVVLFATHGNIDFEARGIIRSKGPVGEKSYWYADINGEPKAYLLDTADEERFNNVPFALRQKRGYVENGSGDMITGHGLHNRQSRQ